MLCLLCRKKKRSCVVCKLCWLKCKPRCSSNSLSSVHRSQNCNPLILLPLDTTKSSCARERIIIPPYNDLNFFLDCVCVSSVSQSANAYHYFPLIVLWGLLHSSLILWVPFLVAHCRKFADQLLLSCILLRHNFLRNYTLHPRITEFILYAL